MTKKPIIILFAMFSLLISGCSSKFAYNNIDWMLYWYVDDYIELDKAQKSLLDVKIESWHTWHRERELQAYRQHLVDMRQDVESGQLSAERWGFHLQQGTSHWERFRDHISPELTSLAVNLTDQQIESFFEILEEDNLENIEERQDSTVEERVKENRKRTQKQVKKWIGRLSTGQKRLVDEHVNEFESTFDEWIKYRRNIQEASKTLLLSRNDNPNFAQQLTTLMANPDQFRSETYLKANQHNRDVFATLLTKLNSTLTEKQRRRAINEIDDLIDDIDDLMND
ncbi:DUF6279 family lipoprotein [Aliiglaciecola sp.]|nr:DUF6279 family lipoprotein [Aliiglaciecola sp.]